MAALFAATHPARTRALVLYEAMPRMSWAPDYDWPPTREEREAAVEAFPWGNGSRIIGLSPSAANDPQLIEWFGRLERLSASPGTARKLFMMNAEVDVRAVLPSISVPTLVVHRAQDRFIDIRHSRYLAEHIPGARFVELEGDEVFSFGSRPGLAGRRDRGVSDRRPAGTPSRARARDRDVLGHRRLDAAGGGARRPALARRAQLGRGHRETRAVRLPRVARSNRWATASSRRSTDPRAGSAARPRSATPSRAVRARGAKRTAHRRDRGDRLRRRRDRGAHRRARRGQRRPGRGRSCRGRSRTWWSGQGSRSTTAATTSCAAFPGNGGCGPWRLSHDPQPECRLRGRRQRGDRCRRHGDRDGRRGRSDVHAVARDPGPENRGPGVTELPRELVRRVELDPVHLDDVEARRPCPVAPGRSRHRPCRG